MLRRRLVLSDSDEEEVEQPQRHHDHQSSPPYPYPSEPLPVSSDDEYIDVSDNLSPPSPVPEPQIPLPPPPPTSADGTCPVSEVLQRLGLSLKREWLDACLEWLRQSEPGFHSLDAAAKAKLCFEQFLVSDMNHCGGGVLPADVASLHLVDLAGPYVLQIDEIVNISNPLKIRYQKANAGLKRTLKLSMTDGVQRVFGMEYRPIPAVETLAPAGLKVVVCNVHIRHGLLMLVPESFQVLGGLVEELEAARLRLVEEVNKPPRGKRTRNGVVPPLAQRAALAAWAPNGVQVPGDANTSTLEAPTPLQASNEGAGRNNIRMTSEQSVPLHRDRAAHQPSSNDVSGVEDIPMDYIPTHLENALPNPSTNGFGVDRLHINPVTLSRENPVPNNAIPNPPFEDALDVEMDIHMDAVSIRSDTQGTRPSSHVILDNDDIHMAEEVEAHVPYQSPHAILDDDDIHLADEVEAQVPYPSSDAIMNDENRNVMSEAVEHPLLLFREREPPFIYLTSLFIRLATMKVQSVRGKVKCFLTGVKGFKYMQKYELQVYIDDGGIIHEIVIDPNLVQKKIGHSAEDVTAALSSPDKTAVANMKQRMKQFQLFLANFEGTMLIELSEPPQLPVALEMNQGCPSSDAWLLLKRLKASSPAQTSESLSFRSPPRRQTLQSFSSRPIEISP